MNSRCRICLRSDGDELISISGVDETQQKLISEMLSVTIGAMLEDNNRMPQHVCDKCLRQLGRAYTICSRIQLSRCLPKCQKGEETKYYRCRVCARQDAEELIFLTCICDRWNLTIDKMINFMVNDVVGSDDRLPPYVCDSCLKDLSRAYGFKTQYLQSLSSLRKEILFAWERMEFYPDNPGHLVRDLYAELIPKTTKQTKGRDLASVYCSVCMLEIALDQLGEECQGCLLGFVISDDIRIQMKKHRRRQYNKVNTALVLNYDSLSPDDLKDMGWITVEEETVQDEYIEEDTFQEDAGQDNEVEEVKKQEKRKKGVIANPWHHNLDIDKLFDVIENNSSEPLQKIRRKGPVCCGCNQFFLTEQEIIEHRKMQHSEATGDRKHICELCLTSFQTLTCLTKHSMQYKQDTYYWCEPCKTMLEDNHFLTIHMFSYHMPKDAEEEAFGKFTSDVTVFNSCGVMGCRKRYKTEEQVLQHFNATHDNENTDDNATDSLNHAVKKVELAVYRCKIDGCTFVTKRRMHLIWHCSQKPHVIPIYKRKKSLKKFIPDEQHFNVIGTLNDGIDILERKSGEFCCGCFKFFETSDDIQKHREESHASTDEAGSNSFRCAECNKNFPTASGISRHTKNVINRTHYFCHPCQFFLFNKVQVNHHQAWCHTNDDNTADETRQSYETIMDDFFTCCACDQMFAEEQDLTQHHIEKHPAPDSTRQAYRCKICRKKYGDDDQLARHTAMYASKTIYNCLVKDCVFQTKSLPSIKRHAAISTHQGIDKDIRIYNKQPTEYFCCVSGCEHVSVTYDNMIEHGLSDHHTKRENNAIKFVDSQLKCSVCLKGFDHEFKLMNHKNGKQIAHCFRCDLTIKRTEYRAHLEQCQAANKHICDICSKEFKSKRFLRNHISSHRNNFHRIVAPTTICSVCGKTLKVASLPDHLLAHENKRMWKCKQCPLSFNTKGLLFIHTRVHTGEKKFKCRYGCDNRYKAGGDRNRHEKLAHLGIREFSCQYCSESFVRERDLRLHGRKHTGLKLFPCKSCGDSFDKLSEFKQHEETCR